MGNFGGINEANPDGNKLKLSVGVHDVEVERCLCVEGFKSGLTYVIEAKVLSSSDPAFFPGVEAAATITGLDDKVKGKMQLDPIPCAGYTWETLAEYSAPDPMTTPPEKHPLRGQRVRITRVDKVSEGGYSYPLWGFDAIPAAPLAA
jgi:hypothetical protein